MTQKVHQVGQLFGWVSGPQTHWGPSGATPFFRPPGGPKNQKWQIRLKTMISHNQSIDNGLLSSHKKFQPNWSKNDWVMTKIGMPVYGIIGILEPFRLISQPNINIFQWDQVYSICTTKLHILCIFHLKMFLNVDFMAYKHQKIHKIDHISVCNFYYISVIKKASHPTFYNIFTWNLEYSFLTKFGS